MNRYFFIFIKKLLIFKKLDTSNSRFEEIYLGICTWIMLIFIIYLLWSEIV